MRRALLVACCSCSRLLGLEEPTLEGVDAARNGDAAKSGCTRDDFEDGVIDNALWLVETNSAVVVNEQGGALTIALPPIDAAFGQVSSRAQFDLATATLEVDVVGTSSQTGAAEMTFSAVFANQTAAVMSTGNGALTTLVFVDPDVVSTARAWEPDQHRFWRIGYDTIRAVAVFSTSRDGLSWAIIDQLPFDAPDLTFTAALGAFTTSMAANPGTARFGSFVVRSPGCAP